MSLLDNAKIEEWEPPLSFEDLRIVSLKRCKRWHGEAGVDDWSPGEWLTAMVGELGELCNYLKKLSRLECGMVGNKEHETREWLREQIQKEFADVQIYFDLFAARCGVDLASVVKAKFNEVSERNGFPERL